MSTEIIKVLDNLAQRFGIAIDWTNQNVMPYIMDLFGRIKNYNVTQNSIMLVIGIVFLIIGVIFTKKILNIDMYENEEIYICTSIILSFLGLFVGIKLISIGLPNLIESIFIPEIQIIELIKGV